MSIAAGTEIRCGRCDAPLYRMRRAIHIGDLIRADAFDPIGVTPIPRDGDRARCWVCGYDLMPSLVTGNLTRNPKVADMEDDGR